MHFSNNPGRRGHLRRSSLLRRSQGSVPHSGQLLSLAEKTNQWVELFERRPSFQDPLPTPPPPSRSLFLLDNFHRLIKPSSTSLSGWLPPKKVGRAEVVSGVPTLAEYIHCPMGMLFNTLSPPKHRPPYLFRALWGRVGGRG